MTQFHFSGTPTNQETEIERSWESILEILRKYYPFVPSHGLYRATAITDHVSLKTFSLLFVVRVSSSWPFRFRSVVKVIAHPVGRKLVHDEMVKKKKNRLLAGCIPINSIFSVRCTYMRVQRLSLIGWISWTRTCCYKLIFLARNEFSLSTSLDYSRSTIWIWKLFYYVLVWAERSIRGKHTFPHRVFPMIYLWTFLL